MLRSLRCRTTEHYHWRSKLYSIYNDLVCSDLSSSNFQSSVTIRKPALLPSSGNGKLPIMWTPVVSLFSVTAHHSNYIFNIPTKCTYTIQYIHYYQHCPMCFGAYCAILSRESFIIRPKQLLRWLIIDLKLYCIWIYNSIYNYVKDHICFNIRVKMLKDHVYDSFYICLLKNATAISCRCCGSSCSLIVPTL